jgi:hypothetical protein
LGSKKIPNICLVAFWIFKGLAYEKIGIPVFSEQSPARRAADLAFAQQIRPDEL